MTSLSRQLRSEPHVGFRNDRTEKAACQTQLEKPQKLVGQGIRGRGLSVAFLRQSNAIAQISTHEKLDLEG